MGCGGVPRSRPARGIPKGTSYGAVKGSGDGGLLLVSKDIRLGPKDI